jgi:hypothetical protein
MVLVFQLMVVVDNNNRALAHMDDHEYNMVIDDMALMNI